jgi:Uma2 family endonuclease
MRRPADLLPLPAHEELRTLPHYLVGEALEGVIYVSSPPIARRKRLTTLLGRAPKGWWWTPEPRLLLEEDLLVPDLAGWKAGRPATQAPGAFIDRVPEWICEVLTPATARLDLGTKLPRYARAGIQHAWVVNPVHRALEVFRQEQGRWILKQAFAGEERVRAEPFESLDFPLTPFWAQG